MHRIVTNALAPFIGVALVVVARPATALMSAPGSPPARVAAGATVGQLAYVTRGGQLRVATVHADGSTTQLRIGPVTSAPTGGRVQVFDLAAGPRDNDLAWTEIDMAKNGSHQKMYLVMRRGSRQPIVIPATSHGWSPLGYVGARLVVSDFTNVAVVTSGQHPHFRPLRTGRKDQPLATDAKGVIVEHGFGLPGKPETFQLLSLAGKRTTLGRLPATDFKGSERQIPIEGVWAAPSGRRVILEQGDHTDFGGVGPTSRAFEISGRHDSGVVSLGHPGAATPIRRMETTSFGRGTPYTVWVRFGPKSTEGSVYAFSGGAWRLVATRSLLVAGNAAGDVVTQPARYRGNGINPSIVPTGDAVLHIVGSTVELQGVRGTWMEWLNPG